MGFHVINSSMRKDDTRNHLCQSLIPEIILPVRIKLSLRTMAFDPMKSVNTLNIWNGGL